MRFWTLVLSFASLATALQAAVPSPEAYFGHRMGADRKLLDWNRVVAYFRSLQENSDRIRVVELGKSVEGRPFIAATIASPQTLRDLDRFRAIQSRLADPRKTDTSEAEQFIATGKTVVLITCSIHSTEVASTQTAIEFSYKLLTEVNPKFQAILENVIFILVPSLNPDGVDIVTRWYRRTLGTPYEGSNPPELYHKYLGHDNNRDWYIFSQPETRIAITQLHNAWHPQIVYDVHQQGSYSSRMFVPPWLDPIDPNVDPILAQLSNAIGLGMAYDLTAAGKTGVAVNALYDFWTPSRHYQSYHGGVRILSESASAKLATPIRVKPDELNQTALGYSPKERSWNHLEPWLGGEWRVRDIVDYQLVAMESCLYQAAIRRQDILRSFYAVGKRAVERSQPQAFVISSRQADPGATRKLLETLAFGQVEIEQSPANFKQFPAGSYVIRMQQPYGSWAKTLLERQNYPDVRITPGGPPRRPYDVTAHTLPLLMGVAVDTVNEPFAAPLTRIEKFEGLRSEALTVADSDSWKLINRLWKSGRGVWRDPVSGTFGSSDTPKMQLLRQPRIGVYKSYVPSMDEGWTRWLLEEFGFKYESVFNRDLAGDLNRRFDVLVFADQRSATLHEGHKSGTMPDEFVGGIGDAGADTLKQFASRGGTLVFLNDAAEYPLQHLGVSVKNALSGISNKDLRTGLAFERIAGASSTHFRTTEGDPDLVREQSCFRRPTRRKGSSCLSVRQDTRIRMVDGREASCT
ncbi:MAG: M14 metallopeptidase family protein [Bryobacteraceae bacterium]